MFSIRRAERLRQDIYRQQLKPRAWIDEKAGHYGISRTPLREGKIMQPHLMQQRVALAHFETGEPDPAPTGR